MSFDIFLYFFFFISHIVSPNIRSRSRKVYGKNSRKKFQIIYIYIRRESKALRVVLQKKRHTTVMVTKTWLNWSGMHEKKRRSGDGREREFFRASICALFVVDFLFQTFFSHVMAYNVTNPTNRTNNSAGSRSSFQQDQHIYEEQPYYANERPLTRQSIGGDSRRTAGVCSSFIRLVKKNQYERAYQYTFLHSVTR